MNKPNTTTQPLLIVIVGPTGVGKTALAVTLARALGSEIVSADSRQVYRYMDIGTAKPTRHEQAQARHHLIDIVDPDQDFGLATYQTLACRAIDDLRAQKKHPLLVGGTGQYIRAVIEGWIIPRVPPDETLRAQLYADAEQSGPQALYRQLLELDPGAGELIDARNIRRVVRALEVCIKSGRPFSQQRGKNPPPYEIIQIGLTMEREALYHRIDARIDAMLDAGLIDEIKRLLDRGYSWSLPALSSLGYAQLRGYLEGTASRQTCVALIKKDTRRFIRQQYNWFRLNNPAIRWFDAVDRPARQVRQWLQERHLLFTANQLE